MWTMAWGRRASLALLASADVAVLVLLRPRSAVVHGLANPHRWIGAVGPDAAAAQLSGAALWLVAGWLGIGLAACAASALPGSIGRLAARLAQGTLPRAVYRLAAGAVGLGVLCAPVSSLGASAATPSRHHARPATSAHPAPAWPTDDPVPAPHWPTSTPSHTSRPHRPPVMPLGDTTPGRPARSVVVAPGDSLWRIAAAHLPERDPSARHIANTWPRWYAANRAVIGADPNHLTLGQVLAVPAPSPQQSPVQEEPS